MDIYAVSTLVMDAFFMPWRRFQCIHPPERVNKTNVREMYIHN